MSELRDILKEEYKKKEEDGFTPQSLMEMVQQVLEATEKLPFLQEVAETPGGENIEDLLPVLKITEDWGKLGKRDRSVIEAFTARLGGEETTIAQKIKALNNFIAGGDPGADISSILTTMMVVETLSTILDEFTESAGGFIFEGFIAGLFGGKSVQITKPEDIRTATGQEVSATGKPITDVVLAGRHYSLKLLGPQTAVAGSFKNMVDHFEDEGIDHVVYLDARREGDDLHFSEFTITLPTFLETFYTPWVRYRKKKTPPYSSPHGLKNKMQSLGDKVFAIKISKAIDGKTVIRPEQFEELLALPDLKQYGPFEIRYSEEKFGGTVKKYYGRARLFNDVQDAIESGDKQKILEALRAVPAYGPNPIQFKLSREQTKLIESYEDLGTLNLGDDALKQTWLNYGEILMATIAPIYRALNSFTGNINNYFLSAPTKKSSRTEYGKKAITDASELKTATDKTVGEVSAAPAPAAIGPQTHRPAPGTPGE